MRGSIFRRCRWSPSSMRTRRDSCAVTEVSRRLLDVRRAM
ncbi:hypothetical protein EVA_19133 [gut metagenome]|uniref:Uncharacterized protein n=1 Tax=gut metagenome TaxID=749906 RepID=J9FZJ0_9ZZZZ